MKAIFRDYLCLCKPKVVLLMILTSMVGICLAPSANFPFTAMILGNLGIAFVAFSAATLNHVADQHIDKLMRRTERRPIAQGKISTKNSLFFAAILCFLGMGILFLYVNALTAILAFISLVGYAVFYTLFLKHWTPQNIVIGGIAGAAPPLLGWTAVTNSIQPEALILVLIIYVWTPPHFWALAIFRLEDYAKANIPMLPYTHDVSFTKLNILLYTILLICATLMPYFIGMSHGIYLLGIITANSFFLVYAHRLYRNDEKQHAIQLFRYSIYYLGILFLLLLIDHYVYREVL